MPIKFICSGCGQELSAAGDLAGEICRCLSCGATMMIPEIVKLGPEQETSNVKEAPLTTEGEMALAEGQLVSDSAANTGRRSRDLAGEDGLRFLAETFKVLGDETRVGILDLLADGPKSVSALVAALGLPQPTVSHHLGLLRTAGMVMAHRQGKSVINVLDLARVSKITLFLLRLQGSK